PGAGPGGVPRGGAGRRLGRARAGSGRPGAVASRRSGRRRPRTLRRTRCPVSLGAGLVVPARAVAAGAGVHVALQVAPRVVVALRLVGPGAAGGMGMTARRLAACMAAAPLALAVPAVTGVEDDHLRGRAGPVAQ